MSCRILFCLDIDRSFCVLLLTDIAVFDLGRIALALADDQQLSDVSRLL